MKPQIQQPCNQKWDNMHPSTNGRHCEMCKKRVVDFSKMTDDEVKTYLVNPYKQNLCGYFYTSQLHINTNWFAAIFLNVQKQLLSIQQPKYFTKWALGLVGLGLVFSGCRARTTGEIAPIPTKADTSGLRIEKE